MRIDLNALITEWHNASMQCKRWAEIENDLRKRLFAEAFPTPTVGRNILKLDHGMALDADYRINYKLNADELQRLPDELISKFVEYKPSINKTAWLKMTDNERKVCADAVTETPGLPGLEIKKQSSIRKW